MSDKSKCLNHPHRDATGRCRRCNTPLCTECKVITQDGTFCSEECSSQFRVFADRAEKLEKAPRRTNRRVLRKLLTAIIAIAVILLVLRYGFGISSLADARSVVNGIIERLKSIGG